MRLLMITRKVDPADALAGFTYGWVERIGRQVDRLFVITWQKSNRGQLPNAIEVISLPKNIILKIIYLQFLLLRFMPLVNGIFCHMNPEYTILVAPLAKIFRRRIVSWYTHRAVTFKTRLMEKCATTIITASPDSFRLASKKVKVIGHGIDVNRFQPVEPRHQNEQLQLLSVGRISPTKDYESMIKAVNILKQSGHNNLVLTIIGDVGLPIQRAYFDSLKRMVETMNLSDRITFLGAMPHQHIPVQLRRADIVINLSGTGSLDKAVLEAMACGCLVLTSNEAFRSLLPDFLLVAQNQPKDLANKIEQLMNMPLLQQQQLRSALRQHVVTHHNLDDLAKKIISQFV